MEDHDTAIQFLSSTHTSLAICDMSLMILWYCKALPIKIHWTYIKQFSGYGWHYLGHHPKTGVAQGALHWRGQTLDNTVHKHA